MPRRRVDMSEKWPGRALPDHSRLTSIRLLAPVRLTRRLCRSPKALECPPVWRFPQLLKRPFPDLPDSFPGDAHQRPDLLERHGFAAFFEAVVEIEGLALTRGVILLEDVVDELAHQLAVRLFLHLPALLASEGCAPPR